MQALFDLEATNQELKSDLRDLYITAAKEVDVNASRKAIIIHVCAFLIFLTRERRVAKTSHYLAGRVSS